MIKPSHLCQAVFEAYGCSYIRNVGETRQNVQDKMNGVQFMIQI